MPLRISLKIGHSHSLRGAARDLRSTGEIPHRSLALLFCLRIVLKISEVEVGSKTFDPSSLAAVCRDGREGEECVVGIEIFSLVKRDSAG